MANFVVIEKDPKVVREITTHIQELSDDHRVQVFQSVEAFEELYFADPVDRILQNANEAPWLQKWPRIALEKIATIGFDTNAKKVFDKPIRLAFHKEHWVLHRIEGSLDKTFLGKDVDSLTNKPLEQVLHTNEAFTTVIEQFKKEINKASKAELALPYEEAPGKPMRVLLGTAITNTLECEITFEDATSDVIKKITPASEKSEDSDDSEKSEKKEDLPVASSVHVLIFQGQQIKKDVKKWITQTFAKLKAANYFPEEGTTRFVAMKWEDDGRNPEDYSHPVVEDVIYLPLDRLIFLQKTEIVSKLPKMTTPSFLFAFKTSLEAEISKSAVISELNDVGFKMINPGPIRTGVFAHFFIQLSPTRPMISVYAKARDSQPHPEEKGKFLVHFDFFGILTKDLTEIRRVTSSNPRFRPHKENDPKKFKFNPDNLFFNDEEKKQKTVVYFDVKNKESDVIVDALKTDLDNVKVIREMSLTRFIQSYFPDEVSGGADVTLFTKEELNSFYPTLVINGEDLKFISVDGEGEEFKFFGYTIEELKTDPELWLKLFPAGLPTDELKDLILVAIRGTTIDTDMVINTKEGLKGKIGLEIRSLTGTNVAILFKPCRAPMVDDLSLKSVKSVDFIIANHAMVPTEIDSWIRGINDYLRKKGLATKNVPFMIISDEKQMSRFRDFCSSTVQSLLVQPINRKALSNQLSFYTNNPFTMHRDNNINWVTQKCIAYVARQTTIESMAEFGATFVNSHPMAVGTNIYLHCKIFEAASDRPVLARVYANEPHPQVKDQFLCHVLFFGIEDQFLKFTRSWIRETYANSKQVEGS